MRWFASSPHALSRAIGFTITGAAASAVQLADGVPSVGAAVSTWALWSVVLGATAAAVSQLVALVLPRRVSRVWPDALGAALTLSYAAGDAIHTRVFGSHVDLPTLELAVDAVRTRTVRIAPVDALAVLVAWLVLASVIALALSLLARLPRLARSAEARLARTATGVASLLVVLVAARDLVVPPRKPWARPFYWHGLTLIRHAAAMRAHGEPPSFGLAFTEAQFAQITSATAKLKDGTFRATAARRPDILLVHVESLRHDMFNETTMPKLWAWRETCWVSPKHYSTSNNTGGGTFGALTGMAATYYAAVRREHTLSPALRVLGALGYARHVHYPNEALTFDHIDELLFGDQATAHTAEGDPVYLADESVVGAYLRDVRSAKPDAPPRFDYLVVDSSHYDYSYPESFRVNVPTATLGSALRTSAGAVVTFDAAVDSSRATAVFNQYKNSVLFVDSLVASILESLRAGGRLERTVVAIFGDHGEAFWERDSAFGHNTQLTDVQTRVPLLLCSTPRLESRYSVTSHADILPTIFDMMGVTTAAPFMTGKSLARYDASADVAILRDHVVGASDERHHAIVLGDVKVGFWDGDDMNVLWVRDQNDDLVQGTPAATVTRALAAAIAGKQFR